MHFYVPGVPGADPAKERELEQEQELKLAMDILQVGPWTTALGPSP